ncbi:MAG: SCO family protein [Phycisphaerae bacterium]|nr:SCO family protein [Phycisphaerae bacterium]
MELSVRAACAAVALLLIAAGCNSRDAAPLPVIAEVPDFSLVNELGRPITRGDLRGRIWVADFIFTHCAGPCPRMSAQMERIQAGVRSYDDVRLVSFSVDPERDSPPVLREYGARYHALPATWTFVTGDRRTIHRLAIDGFKLSVEDETASSPILHSTRFMLVDRVGRIRGAYDGEDEPSVRKLLADIERLRREAPVAGDPRAGAS